MENLFTKTQENMLTTFRYSLEAQKAVEKLGEGLVDASLVAQETTTKLAKSYFDSMKELQKEWVKTSTEMVEKAIEASSNLFAFATKK
ncbi:MAG: hypothetical protein JNN15_09280 [Blastocatellia bacterium]|nr:hypothetical protein [Blastocatellia bacterium]